VQAPPGCAETHLLALPPLGPTSLLPLFNALLLFSPFHRAQLLVDSTKVYRFARASNGSVSLNSSFVINGEVDSATGDSSGNHVVRGV